jgi:hypothetical protein
MIARARLAVRAETALRHYGNSSMIKVMKVKPSMVLNHLRHLYDNRPHTRDGIYTYLAPLYEAVLIYRNDAGFWQVVDGRLSRTTKEKPFADVIEVTSDVKPKMRWKYARALARANRRKIAPDDVVSFLHSHGHLNGVIAAQSSSRRRTSPQARPKAL